MLTLYHEQNHLKLDEMSRVNLKQSIYNASPREKLCITGFVTLKYDNKSKTD